MKNVTKELLNFSDFLNLNFPLINKIFQVNSYNDSDQMWKLKEIFLQANWEILVEMQICDENHFLEYYDSGADLFPESYRVINSDVNGNTKIVVSSDKAVYDYFNNNFLRIDNFNFIRFVSHLGDGNFAILNPFDYVVAEDYQGNEYLLNKEDIQFIHVYS